MILQCTLRGPAALYQGVRKLWYACMHQLVVVVGRRLCYACINEVVSWREVRRGCGTHACMRWCAGWVGEAVIHMHA